MGAALPGGRSARFRTSQASALVTGPPIPGQHLVRRSPPGARGVRFEPGQACMRYSKPAFSALRPEPRSSSATARPVHENRMNSV